MLIIQVTRQQLIRQFRPLLGYTANSTNVYTRERFRNNYGIECLNYRQKWFWVSFNYEDAEYNIEGMTNDVLKFPHRYINESRTCRISFEDPPPPQLPPEEGYKDDKYQWMNCWNIPEFTFGYSFSIVGISLQETISYKDRIIEIHHESKTKLKRNRDFRWDYRKTPEENLKFKGPVV